MSKKNDDPVRELFVVHDLPDAIAAAFPGGVERMKKGTAKKFIVNRRSFMAWVDGVLLDRDASGACVVGDHERHEQAEKILESGGTIYFADDGGEVVSRMTDTGEGYEEQEL